MTVRKMFRTAAVLAISAALIVSGKQIADHYSAVISQLREATKQSQEAVKTSHTAVEQISRSMRVSPVVEARSAGGGSVVLVGSTRTELTGITVESSQKLDAGMIGLCFSPEGEPLLVLKNGKTGYTAAVNLCTLLESAEGTRDMTEQYRELLEAAKAARAEIETKEEHE